MNYIILTVINSISLVSFYSSLTSGTSQNFWKSIRDIWSFPPTVTGAFLYLSPAISATIENADDQASGCCSKMASDASGYCYLMKHLPSTRENGCVHHQQHLCWSWVLLIALLLAVILFLFYVLSFYLGPNTALLKWNVFPLLSDNRFFQCLK